MFHQIDIDKLILDIIYTYMINNIGILSLYDIKV